MKALGRGEELGRSFAVGSGHVSGAIASETH